MIFAFKDILKLRRKLRGERVVFVSGCFDILHEGHIQFLLKAATYGDALVVGVLPDAYIREKKRRESVHTQRQRAYLLDALKPVTHVVLHPPAKGKFRSIVVLRALRPDIFFRSEKNHTYLLIEKELNALGIRLVSRPMRKVHSTSRTIQRVRAMSL
jgi:D-glycero-beta-D-manno-heptose 1-phosphate adenylyltransferase